MGFEPPGSLKQVGFIDDVVTLEYGPGLVTGHLHGDSFGNAGADQVPDRASAEVMKDAGGNSGPFAGRLPVLFETTDSFSLPAPAFLDEENPRADDASLFECVDFRSL